MINRNYLPYQTAREHQDRGMAKWMGFFLSEHSTALQQDKNKFVYHVKQSQEEILLILQQLYLTQELARFTIRQKNHSLNLSASVFEIALPRVILKTKNHYHKIELINILSINEFIDNED